MKKPKELIEDYAHDYSFMKMNQAELEKMLWSFWREAEEESRQSHLDHFCTIINSYGFKEWYNSNLSSNQEKNE